MAGEPSEPKVARGNSESESEEEEVEETWDDWRAGDDDDDDWGGPGSSIVCLFCTEKFDSSELMFGHCTSQHGFDFDAVVKGLRLGFYGSIKLVNYIRSKVSENKCWTFEEAFEGKGNREMLKDINSNGNCAATDPKFLWDDDMYLRPYLEDDPLLHSLSMDDDDDDVNGDTDVKLMNKEEIIKEIGPNLGEQFGKLMQNGVGDDEGSKERSTKVLVKGAAARERKDVDEDYFGSYSSFGIHREMLSDKVRTDAYRDALLNNPSLLNEATVLDVGCGTGILSLFAAKAGASRVLAVEASAKMASIATQIAKDNDAGVITVVHSMVEDIERNLKLEPRSVDVLVSEWMGYCLLFESMLSSVLFARDRYLKPGGAILPDKATIFGAGFGKGGTSMPFWENVYGFNMSCVGKELWQDAARIPIVDTIDPLDIITESAAVHSFDLVTMTQDDMDFTSTVELRLRTSHVGDHINWCHGLVLWFDTDFSARFCKESPTSLSTSPYGPKTHWAQTILTFKEPIAMCSNNGRPTFSGVPLSKKIGTGECPATMVRIRVSIARASHRSIDISLEAAAVGFDCQKDFPAQIFNL